MQQPFSPDPKWRNHFNFTVLYLNINKKYSLELHNKSILEFKLDPVLNKFNIKNT